MSHHPLLGGFRHAASGQLRIARNSGLYCVNPNGKQELR
jgi:hypothetical protein